MSGDGSTDNFTVVSTRRIWSQSEKLLIVSEAVAPGASICAVARRHKLSSSLLYRWIKYFKGDEPAQKPAFVPIALAPPGGGGVGAWVRVFDGPFPHKRHDRSRVGEWAHFADRRGHRYGGAEAHRGRA